MFIAVCKNYRHSLLGYWGPFPNEMEADEFMESKGIPIGSYTIRLLNNPNNPKNFV